MPRASKEGPPPRRIDARAAAPYLGVSVVSLRKLVRRREIPHIRIGRRVIFDVADLDRYLAGRRVDAHPALA